MTEQALDKKIKEDKWKNRRKFASISLAASLGYIAFIAVFFQTADPERIKAATELGSISLAVLGFFGTIIGAYITAATYHQVKEEGNGSAQL